MGARIQVRAVPRIYNRAPEGASRTPTHRQHTCSARDPLRRRNSEYLPLPAPLRSPLGDAQRGCPEEKLEAHQGDLVSACRFLTTNKDAEQGYQDVLNRAKRRDGQAGELILRLSF